MAAGGATPYTVPSQAGVPRMDLSAPTPTVQIAGPRAAAPKSSAETLLNEVGELSAPLPAGQAEGWKQELKQGKAIADRTALLHLWIGEWELAERDEPVKAGWHFRRAMQLAGVKQPVHGLAAYNAAMGLFYEGRYEKAMHAFERLASRKTALPGYDLRGAAMWRKHAGACFGYHDERRKAGITEPERLDALCGASSLALCLRALKSPSTRLPC
jgi:hypothetical protein